MRSLLEIFITLALKCKGPAFLQLKLVTVLWHITLHAKFTLCTQIK